MMILNDKNNLGQALNYIVTCLSQFDAYSDRCAG